MRPKTKIPIPAPSGSEFENFDRLTRILVSVKPQKKGPVKHPKPRKAK